MKLHTDRQYESQLRQVGDNLLRMSGCVEQMIAEATRALLDGDLELARHTIDADHRVNRLEVETDDLCLLILAKRQPVASDLRFITLAMKMVTDLERIGDLAVNISERVLALDGYRPASTGPILGRMSEIDQALLREAIDCFVKRDADKAQDVHARDEEVDRLYLQLCNDVEASMHRDREFLERGMHVQAVAKFLERIGDHVTNLAELVIFLVKGKDVRHSGKLDPSDR
jgi:phosphate transport system protein